eukprot:11192695-Lingulodinium_polyedra.AAC.1
MPYQLEVVEGSYHNDLELPAFAEDELMVLEDLHYADGHMCHSRGPLLDLNTWFVQYPSKMAQERAAGQKLKVKITKKDLEEFPWLQIYQKKVEGKGQGGFASSSEKPDAEDQGIDSGIDEVYAELVSGFADLEGNQSKGEDFFSRNRGLKAGEEDADEPERG